MKLARASQAEIDTLMRWLQARENAKYENVKDRPPAFMRVVFGYETLVNNCCDPAKDYLDFKPGHSPSQIASIQAENAKLREALTYIDRQVREVWAPLPGDTYQSVHRGWCIEQAAKARENT